MRRIGGKFRPANEEFKGFRPGKVAKLRTFAKMFGRDLMGELGQHKLVDEDQPESARGNELRLRACQTCSSMPTWKRPSKCQAEPFLPPAYRCDARIHASRHSGPSDHASRGRSLPTNRSMRPSAVLPSRYIQYVAACQTAKARMATLLSSNFVGKGRRRCVEVGTVSQTISCFLGAEPVHPGFEEQLSRRQNRRGKRADTFTFPEGLRIRGPGWGKPRYSRSRSVKYVHSKSPELDDDSRRSRLMTGAKLRGLVKDQLPRPEHDNVSRRQGKRDLLGQAGRMPRSRICRRTWSSSEFSQIWQQCKTEMDAGRVSDEDSPSPENEPERRIPQGFPQRRGRLGALCFAEYRSHRRVRITEQEVKPGPDRGKPVVSGQERQSSSLPEEPEMRGQLRAPIYEDKLSITS